MKTKISRQTFDRPITFYTPTGETIVVETAELTVFPRDGHLYACCLNFEVDFDQYQQIDQKAFFNLMPDLRGNLSGEEFSPGIPVTLTANLQPELLGKLAGNGDRAKAGQIIETILEISETQPDHPILQTEQWFALSVEQSLSTGKTGYRTLWDYVKPAADFQAKLTEGNLFETALQFYQDRGDLDLTKLTGELSQTFDQEVDTYLRSELQQMMEELTFRTTQALGEPAGRAVRKPTADLLFNQPSLMAVMEEFFVRDEWAIHRVEGENAFKVAASGNSGEWPCLAQINETQQQILFFSICPVHVPANARMAMAEFITRANHGLAIGNFELDFNNGQVRYKTGVDLEDVVPSFALLHHLIYANVLTMDYYLPSLMSVMYGQVSPIEAISQLEGNN